MDNLPRLTPLLVVRDATRAIDFYVAALGVEELARFMNKRTGSVGHADLAIGNARFSVSEEARAWNSDAPPSLGGSPVVLQLEVADVDAAFGRMCNAGSAVVFPLPPCSPPRSHRPCRTWGTAAGRARIATGAASL